MADKKYFLYSEDQIKEKNKILERLGKKFCPGSVSINGRMHKFTQLSNQSTIPRFPDTKVIASGDPTTFVYVMPSEEVGRGS